MSRRKRLLRSIERSLPRRLFGVVICLLAVLRGRSLLRQRLQFLSAAGMHFRAAAPAAWPFLSRAHAPGVLPARGAGLSADRAV